jgi:hypothetical protein
MPLNTPASIPIKFTGPVSLNSRTFSAVAETLTNVGADKMPLQGRPMHLPELMQLLNYLEICVMTDKLYFDGTLPNHEMELLAAKTGWLQNYSKNQILPITANNSDTLIGYCCSAAEQSSELIRAIDLASLTTNGTDKPVKQISGFRSAILKNYGTRADRLEAARQIADDTLAGKDSFNGGKCVVGILTAELEDMDLLDVVTQKFNACPDELHQSYLVGALINRFRINFINKLSSQDQYEAAYLIDPSIETIQAQQITLLWKYILKRIERKNTTFTHFNQLEPLFKGRYSTFPLGLAAFLNYKSTDPHELLRQTQSLKSDLFNKVAAKHTPQVRFVHQFDEQSFEDFQDDVLGGILQGIVDKKHKGCTFLNNRVPEILGVAVNQAFGGFLKDIHFILDVVMEYTKTELAKQVMAKGMEMIMPNHKYNVFLNNMQKLETYYRDSLSSHADVNRRMEKQVERIFNRPLVL